MGAVEKKKRVPLLKSYLVSLKTDWHALITLQKEVLESTGKSAIYDPLPELIQYQITTLDYGIALFEFEINWYENLINKIESGEHP